MKDIVLKAMGQAISKTVAISEILKVSALLIKLGRISSNCDFLIYSRSG